MSRSLWICCLLAPFVRRAATEWQLHERTNCWEGAGAATMPGANPAPGAVSWDDCKQMCEADVQCGGVVVQRRETPGRCYMRKNLNVGACQGHNDYDLWELKARERLASDIGMGSGMGEEAPPVKPPPLSISISTPPRPVFKNLEAGYHTYRIPALVSVGGDEVLAFIEGRTGGGDNGRIDVVMKRSSDGGVTWGPAVTVVKSDGDIARGNPSPVYDEKGGRLLLVFCYNNKWVFVQSSDDKGVTWSVPRNISSMVKRPGWGWVATGPGHSMQLRAGAHAGRIVVPFNTFFADAMVKTVVHQRGCAKTDECAQYYSATEKSLDVMVEITNPLDPDMGTLQSKWYNDTTSVPPFVWAGDRSGVFYSDDGGDSWKLGGMVDSRLGSSECMAAESDKGLLLSFRVEDADTHCRKMAVSKDGGESFEPYFEPEECILDPVCQGSLVSLGDGRVMACGPGSAGAREDTSLYVSRTAAGGRQTGPSAAPLGFSKLGVVSKGAGGYTDVVALKASPAGVERVGVLWELGFQGGASYAVVNIPSSADTDFEDPEDPWAAVI